MMVICTLLSALFIQPMFGMDRVWAASYVAAGEYDGIGADTIGNCVAFARYKVPSLPGGLYNLQDKQNIINSHTPMAGAIAITRGNSSYGHVAYVESVSGANVVTLNGGFSGSGLTGHIVRITGTESEQGILGYWYPAGVSAGNNPQGCVDVIEGGVGTIHVGGWVFDRDDVNASVSLHVYIGGAAGEAGAEGHVLVANGERPDVGNAYPGVGSYHGFDGTFQTEKRGSQPVYIYAINIGGGTENPLIGQGTVNIDEIHTPQGVVDSVLGGEGTVTVKGWTFDRDNVNASVSCHVYIGGEAGTPGAECHIITADKERISVGNAYPGVGNYHGFDEVIQTNMRGNQDVYIYAINVGAGTDNSLLGSKQVTIIQPAETPSPLPTIEPVIEETPQPTKEPSDSTASPSTRPSSTPNSSVPKESSTPASATNTPKPSSQDAVQKLTPVPSIKPVVDEELPTISVPKVQGLSVKNQRGRKAKCSWRKVTGSVYYSVQFASNRSFTKGNNGIKVYGTKHTRYSLKKKKTYYVRVRAWKYVEGRGYVAGNWSAVKKVKIRK